ARWVKHQPPLRLPGFTSPTLERLLIHAASQCLSSRLRERVDERALWSVMRTRISPASRPLSHAADRAPAAPAVFGAARGASSARRCYSRQSCCVPGGRWCTWVTDGQSSSAGLSGRDKFQRWQLCPVDQAAQCPSRKSKSTDGQRHQYV